MPADLTSVRSDERAVSRVIVYRVRLGEAAPFQAWLKTINDRARVLPGIEGIDVIPSAVDERAHEWIVVYRFRDDAGFQAWFASRERRELIENTPAFFAEKQVEYTLGGRQSNDDGRAIVTLNAVLHGKEADYEAADGALNEAAARFPGFVDSEVFKPPAGGNIWSTHVRFDSKANMDRWLASKERAAGCEAMFRFLASHHGEVVPTGFGSWFAVNALDSLAAPAWKQAMIVLVALFPLVMVLNLTIGAILAQRGVAFPVMVFISNALGTIALTWALMPVVTRLMDWWLSPRATPNGTWLGLALVVALYAVEIAVFTFV